MKFSVKSVIVIAALVGAITAATVSVAAPSGNSQKSATPAVPDPNGAIPGPPGLPPPGFGMRLRGDPGEHLAAFAKELGVSTSKLQAALDAVRQKLGPPKPPNGTQPPTRAEMEQRCTDLTNALASELGKTGDEVRAAAKAVAKADIASAVKAKRLTQAQADQILKRIDAAKCLPPLGGPGFHVFGCGGPPPGAGVAPGAGSGRVAPQSSRSTLEFAPAA
jgi:hypothetical protein